jgi:O-methyltransferase
MKWKEALNTGLGKSLGLQLVSRESLAHLRAQAPGAGSRPEPRRLARREPGGVEAKAARGGRLPGDYGAEFAEIWDLVKHRTMTGHEKGYYLHQAVRYVTAHKIPGAIVECGVWRGGSMLNVAHTLARLGATDRELFLFDTYSGMSEPTDRDVHLGRRGAATTILANESRDSRTWAVASLDDVSAGFSSVDYPRERLHFVQGKVEDTIPGQAPQEIAILRLDTDWYESTKHELEQLWDKLEPGGVLIIDDYGHWAGARDAVDEFFAGRVDAPLLSRIDYTGRIGVKR